LAIHPDTKIGSVRLIVADLEAARAFYERAIGLRELRSSGEALCLGSGEESLVELVGRPEAPPRGRRTTGLFHLAILVPDRAGLARALRRVTEAGWRIDGASDHLVSEALYLSDPEGNGIEIYRDRPREEWRYVDGSPQMATLPLDLQAVLGELEGSEPETAAMPAGTRIGHVHLQVADLATAEDFYAVGLGFEVTVRGLPGALFLSAGGYHHHLGLNTWAGEGAAAPAPGSRGLSRFEIRLAGAPELALTESALVAAGFAVQPAEDGVRLADPFGVGVLLRAPGDSG
jgi:catechol 2,3-dioxygenase